MTTHIKKDGTPEQEPEEDAEDGEPELSQVEEEESKSKFKGGRRDSALSEVQMEKKQSQTRIPQQPQRIVSQNRQTNFNTFVPASSKNFEPSHQ